ncbi:MAG: hypothetical protein ACLQGJ_00890 [Candidatus Dormibacteria bacterium]
MTSSSKTFGHYLGSFGSEGAGNDNFNQPEGIAVDAYDNIFVNDYGNERVQVWTPPPA